MESYLENKASVQAFAQSRKAEFAAPPELNISQHQSNFATYINRQDDDKSDSEKETKPSTKKTIITMNVSKSNVEYADVATSAPGQSSNLRLSIICAIELGTPASKLDGYALSLFRHLYQMARAGKIIFDIKDEMDANEQTKTDVNNALLEDINDMKLRKYIVHACNTITNGDKLTPHRFVGPSSQQILKYYPEPSSCKVNLQRFLWHLLTWRLFGFSRLEVIQKLKGTTNVDEALGVLSEVDKSSGKPITVISAYGNFRIPVDKRQAVLNGLNRLSQILSQKLMTTEMAFSDVLDAIKSQNVLFLPRDGLLSWLIVCDLAEWNLCAPPTVMELSDKIGQPPFEQGKKAKGGAGTREALIVVREACKLEFPFKTSEEFQTMLSQVFDALKHEVGDECKQLQGRDLTMADMEHMLCKISRLSKLGNSKGGKE